MRVIGTTIVTKGWKISLIKDVRDKLGVNLKDKLVYYETDKGEIVIKKA
jgi:bifunctional DNA-binding transcriptional regulator/antitoxin component of YhaV-PrlF toxin-antitoxin module